MALHQIPPKHTQSSWLKIMSETTVGLALALPLLVPFSLGRNIDMQACIVWALGTTAWVTLFIQRQRIGLLRSWLWWPLGLYGLGCLIALWVHPTVANLLGLEHSRLGVFTLLACAGCGLISQHISEHRLAWGIYISSVVVAASTIPYALLTSSNLARTGGVFHQPDFLAIWLVCGCVVSLGLRPKQVSSRIFMILSLVFMGLIVLLTETRAAIVLLILIALLITVRELRSRQRIVAVLSIIGATMLLAAILHNSAPHSRIIDRNYSGESLRYRASLQSYGVQAVRYQPVTGYGPDNIQTGLSCLTFHDPALIKTCRQGYYFTSSHNIFLDRFIGLGVIGGCAFLITVGGLLYAGIRSTGQARYFWYAALVLCAYYCTNVTSVSLELLLWILLCRAWRNYEI
jgi:O-antigen ligase